MCKKLRNVTFTLEGAALLNFERPGMFDYENGAEREEATKSRKGFFHQWGNTPNGDNIITCGIVEDCTDGQIYCVPPTNIKFESNEN